jgi:rhomboid protease GluP
MAFSAGRGRYFEIPHLAVYLLAAANIAAFGLCLTQSDGPAIPSEVLFRYGAMYSLAIERHEYWRLLASGFLHTGLIHLATNMLCLVLWGGLLEKRIGPSYFLLIYVCAVIAGGIVSNATHSGPYLSVGASGGISGVLGALLCLWILGKIDLTASFFVANIGLNIALGATAARIDWGAHLGGFAAGLIACALLDLVERLAPSVLRCKFPEFVKINGLIGAGVLAGLLWDGGRIDQLTLLAWAGACLVFVKAIDLLLSIKKGLAVVVAVLAAANAALAWFAVDWLLPLIAQNCVQFPAACANPGLLRLIVTVGAACLTMAVLLQEFYRGINDVGFVGATFRAERNRRHGI